MKSLPKILDFRVRFYGSTTNPPLNLPPLQWGETLPTCSVSSLRFATCCGPNVLDTENKNFCGRMVLAEWSRFFHHRGTESS